eukprot:jgi/Psemu1/13509/gm1.13509_g
MVEYSAKFEANPAAATRLSCSYFELLSPTDIEWKDIFIHHNDDKTTILAPDPLTYLRGMDHITQLLPNCTITAIKSMHSNESKKPIHGQTDLDNAARAARASVEQATTNGEWESSVFILVSIDCWRFKPNWNASLFNNIYEDQSTTSFQALSTYPLLRISLAPFVCPFPAMLLRQMMHRLTPELGLILPAATSSDSVSFRRVNSSTSIVKEDIIPVTISTQPPCHGHR